MVELNEETITLQEGRKEFLAWAGADEGATNLLNNFLNNRQKFPAPQNNMDWWVKNKSPQELQTYISNFKSKTAKEKEEREEGTKLVYNDEDWKVLRILTYEAAQQYGKGSKWCICGNYPGFESRGKELFDQYLRNDFSGYFLFLNKHPEDETKDGKYMVCVEKDNPSKVVIYNQQDYTIRFIPNGPSIKGFPSVSQFTIFDGKLVKCEFDISGEGIQPLTIPEGVTSIKYNTFEEAPFTRIILPSTLKKIESGCFLGSKIGSIIIPDSVEEIGKGILCNCENLTSAVFGSGIKSIPSLTFAYDNKLSEVTFKGKIDSIEDSAFKLVKDCRIFCNGNNELLVNYGREHNLDVVDTNTDEIISDRQD